MEGKDILSGGCLLGISFISSTLTNKMYRYVRHYIRVRKRRGGRRRSRKREGKDILSGGCLLGISVISYGVGRYLSGKEGAEVEEGL